jgi:hypothetical protein
VSLATLRAGGVGWRVAAALALAIGLVAAGPAAASPDPAAPASPDPESTPTPTLPGTPSPPGPGEPGGPPVDPQGSVATPTPSPSGDAAPPPADADPPTLSAVDAERACREHRSGCDPLAALGSLERASVEAALNKRMLTIDQAPWGKRIGAIHVYAQEVFTEDPYLALLNYFHITTREEIVRREVLPKPGAPWDDAIVEESARRLRDPLWSSVALVLPVMPAHGGAPDVVDLLVVTRDIWSLRLNTKYTYQSGSLTNFGVSLSENNFLGTHTLLAYSFVMDQAQVATGPVFINKNLLGHHLDLRASAAALVSRQALLDDHGLISEGSQSAVSLSRPLWSLAQEWGAGVSVSHRYAIERQFYGTRVLTYNAPETPGDDMLPWAYRMRRWSVSAYVTRQFGDAFKHQLTFGHSVDSQRPTVLDTFPTDPVLRAAFERDVLPRSELSSAPYVEYGLFQPRYGKLRNVSTYDLPEDVRFGPEVDVTLAAGLHALGSQYHFYRGSATAAWTEPWREGGQLRASAGVSLRYQDGRFIDNTAGLLLRAVAPARWGLRFVTQGSLDTRWNESQNRFFTIGSDTGLRGFLINQFAGQRRLSLQAELRTMPTPVWVVKLGGVLFYDGGGAANSLAEMRYHHDAGVGVRVLIPQTSRELFRFDLAFPLDGAARGTPRFIAGFESAF